MGGGNSKALHEQSSYSCVVVTGASSGIGAAVAIRFAAKGMTLGITGRNAQRLEAVAHACRAKGAAVQCGVLDTQDAAGMEAFLAKVHASSPLELVVANAGVMALEQELTQGLSEVADVNLRGTLNTVLPTIRLMQQRQPAGINSMQRGHIAVVSSVSALPKDSVLFAGLMRMGLLPYTWTKKALLLLAEGLRAELEPQGICVTAICPGVVQTRMAINSTCHVVSTHAGSGGADPAAAGVAAADQLQRLGAVMPEEAADAIFSGLMAGQAMIAFPERAARSMKVMGCMPAPFLAKLVRRAMERNLNPKGGAKQAAAPAAAAAPKGAPAAASGDGGVSAYDVAAGAARSRSAAGEPEITAAENAV